ncbi:hypothetical protein C0J52_25767 [Blattella germanica]|nr:hypothetical protein C0J52_25767 [Blattella germanica]
MEFFDDTKNWGQSEVKVGRSWKTDELRIKSNEDLHKLWFVLLKERNMLKTMEHECKEQTQLFPNPERIDKFVKKEKPSCVRSHDTRELDAPLGLGPQTTICLKYLHRTCEYLLPKFMNRKWQKNYATYSHTSDVKKFLKLYREKLFVDRRKAERFERIGKLKMADDVKDGVECALEKLVNVSVKSSNLRNDLKKDILEAVSTLINIFVNVRKDLNSKEAVIAKLGKEVKEANEKLRCVESSSGSRVVPILGGRPAAANTTGQQVASSGAARRYSDVVGGSNKEVTRFKLMVKSKENQNTEAIKAAIKRNINPTAMKIGICSMKSLRDGRVMIEANSKQEIELLDAAIREKCCQQLDANIPKLWNPNLIVFNIPEDVTVENAEEIIINQNPELNLTAGDIKPKFPNLDEEAVKEEYPSVDIQKIRYHKKTRGHHKNIC